MVGDADMLARGAAVSGAPRLWLRLEGAAVLAIAALLYAQGGHSWPLFAMLFFAPDLSLAAYAIGTRAGAMVYNLAHSYVGPLVLGAAMLLTERSPAVALTWAAHIGFDRAVGYGLKYPDAFELTHLGRIGSGRNARK